MSSVICLIFAVSSSRVPSTCFLSPMSAQANKRLNKEYKQISSNPPPYIIARPHEQNILDWHYVITGPPDTPYEGGQYHGRITFPSDYPFKPPRIKMTTPSGRFAPNTRLCLSMSDYHEESWNPSWSVATILTGLLSFMTGTERTTGSIETTKATKLKLAAESRAYNAKMNPIFKEVFPELYQENLDIIAGKIPATSSRGGSEKTAGNENNNNDNINADNTNMASTANAGGASVDNSRSASEQLASNVQEPESPNENLELDKEDQIRALKLQSSSYNKDNGPAKKGGNKDMPLWQLISILAVVLGLLYRWVF